MYSLAEESTPITENLTEMESYLKRKKIVIIGGHDNWTNKLKVKFPEWKYISTEISSVIDACVLIGSDYIYFFTDHIAHKTYKNYIRLMREQHLKFGYIHSVNIDSNIRQIYNEIS